VAKAFIEHFVRDELGAWTCVSPAEIQLPTGHIEVAPGTRLVRGTRFMGIDLAELLEKQDQARRQ